MQNTPEIQKLLNQFCRCKLSGEELERGVSSYGYLNYLKILKEVHEGVYNNFDEIYNKYNELMRIYYVVNEKKTYCSLIVKAIRSKYGRTEQAENLITKTTKEIKESKDTDDLMNRFDEIYCSVMLY